MKDEDTKLLFVKNSLFQLSQLKLFLFSNNNYIVFCFFYIDTTYQSVSSQILY